MATAQDALLAKAMKEDPGAEYGLSQIPFPSLELNNRYVRVGQHQFYNICTKNLQYSAQGSVSNLISNGGSVDIRIPARSFAYADHMTLHLRITNSTGAATTLVPARWLFNRIEIWANNGQRKIADILPEELWASTALFSSDQWEHHSALENTTADWGSPTAISNGTTVDYYVRLTGNIFGQIKLPMMALDGDLVIRPYFEPFSKTNAASGAAPTLTALNVIFNCVVLDQKDYLLKQAEYRSKPHIYDYLDGIRQLWPAQAITAGQSLELRLSGIRGRIPGLFVFVRANNPTGANLYGFADLDNCTFDLLTPNGDSMLIYQPSGRFLRFHEFSERFVSSRFGKNVKMYYLSFSTDPVADLTSGTNFGYQVLTGDERIRINFDAAFTPGTYEVGVLLYKCSELIVDTNGVARSTE